MKHADIASFVEAGLVTARAHDGLVIYNYTDRCTFAREWNPITLACRGLIMPVGEDVVIARPFGKFFNHGEPGAVLPTRPPDLVSDKRDGSLGISYWWGGRIRWATRGSMTSSQAVIAQRVWDTKHAHVRAPVTATLLVEIESPEIESIVRADCERLVLLAIRDIATGVEWSWASCVAWAESVGIPFAEAFPFSVEDCLARAKTLPADHEGWVLRWDCPDGTHRLKVKGREYLAIARLIQALGDRGAADAWYYRRADMLEKVPEEFRAEIEARWMALDVDAAVIEADAARLHREIAGLSRREAVAHVGPQHPVFGLVMKLLDGKAPDYRGFAYTRKTGHRFPRPDFDKGETP
jgi:RNA ligase